MRRLAPALLLAILVAVSAPTAGAEGVPGARLVPAWPGVKFTWPDGVVDAGDGSLYVLEQKGRVIRMPKPGTPGTPKGSVFLDLTSKIHSGGQGGLLGLAFHPQYARNGRIFVDYLTPTGDANVPFRIVVSEIQVKAGVPDPATERVLIQVPKTTPQHNGGTVLFGPDGKLYVSTGDNKIQKEAVQTSQNPASLLGKILRIDVDTRSPGLPYGIPADNPWAGAGAGVRGEIWAYGLRNPWRFSFAPDGSMWTCQPGTKGECREAVTKVVRGGNHGWPYFEGTRPMEPMPPGTNPASFVKPLFEYVRTGGEGRTAAVGGHVYRGSRVPSLKGAYIFGDYGRGAAMALDVSTGRGANLRVIGRVPDLASLGEDKEGELYFCAMEEGVVYTLVAAP